MTSQSKKFKIGLFVITGMVLMIVALVWLGASRYFEEAKTVVAYFSESVQGLEADSPVKFRGVPVGRVSAIRLAPDGRLIEVVMSLARHFKVTDDLGIKMNLLGLTGMKYLEIDTFPPDQRREAVVYDFQPRYPVIATYPSDIKEFGSALDNLFQKVKTVDAQQISRNLVSVTGQLDKFLRDGKLDKIAGETSDTLRDIREAARRLHDEINRNQPAKQAVRALDKASGFFDESSETARNVDRMVRRTDKSLSYLTQKLDTVADNLIAFTRMIRQKPSSILFGGQDKEADGKR
jgi:phospholipid/cholesterol/gamma-HCH transport system substrate-binding protein